MAPWRILGTWLFTALFLLWSASSASLARAADVPEPSSAEESAAAAAHEPEALSGSEEPRRSPLRVFRDTVDAGGEAVLPPVPEGFSTYDGGWLSMAFPPAKRHRVQPLISEADAFRDRLRSVFDYPVLQRVTVRIARTPGEMAGLAPAGSPYPKYAEGVAYPRLRLVLLTIDPKHPNSAHDLAEVFRHELAHIALHEALEGHHVPVWLNEGFAIHLSGESSLARMQTLWTATLAETLLPLAHLDASFPDDIVQTPIAYAQSADVVRHLLRTRYTQRFVTMLRRVRGGQPFANAMHDAYGFDAYGLGANTLEDEWRRDVAKRYSFWPVLFSGSMVWMGALGLFVVGYYRRRKQQRLTLERWAIEEAAEQLPKTTSVPTTRMHIVLAPKTMTPTPPPPLVDASGSEVDEELEPEFKKPTRDMDIPKVEHEGSWHTLH